MIDWIGTNSRKRGRETSGVMQQSQNIMNHQFSLQSQSPHLIDLTQLQNHHQQQQQNQNIVSTGLGLSFGDQQHQRLQLLQQQHGCHSSHFLSLLSNGLASQIKQQKDEIDQFLQAQVQFLVFGLVGHWNEYQISKKIKKLFFLYKFFINVFFFLGRRVTTDNRRKETEKLSADNKDSRGNGGASIKRKRNRFTKSHAQEHRVRSMRRKYVEEHQNLGPQREKYRGAVNMLPLLLHYKQKKHKIVPLKYKEKGHIQTKPCHQFSN